MWDWGPWWLVAKLAVNHVCQCRVPWVKLPRRVGREQLGMCVVQLCVHKAHTIDKAGGGHSY